MATTTNSTTITQTTRYVDLDLDFDAHPISEDVVLKFDAEAVKRAVRNLVLTRKYDRFFHPEIESGVAGMLFDLITPGTKLRLQTMIRDVIRNYEPRAIVNNVGVVESTDGHGLDVTIEYFIQNRQEPQRISFTVATST